MAFTKIADLTGLPRPTRNAGDPEWYERTNPPNEAQPVPSGNDFIYAEDTRLVLLFNDAQGVAVRYFDYLSDDGRIFYFKVFVGVKSIASNPTQVGEYLVDPSNNVGLGCPPFSSNGSIYLDSKALRGALPGLDAEQTDTTS